MKKIYSYLFAFVLSWSTQAQLLTPSILGSVGSQKSNGGIVLEDHLGSLMTGIVETRSFMYTEGFIQPDFGTMQGTGVFINNVVLDGSNYLLDGAGQSVINGTTLLEYTLGEFACTTLVNNPTMLTQGLLQPNSCTPVLTLTPANLPLIGSYQARDEIILSGLMSIKDYDVIFNAPKITVIQSLNVDDASEVMVKSIGCVTN
jgi:hypothetical protein